MSDKSKIEPKQFVNTVRKSGILSETQFETWLNRVKQLQPGTQQSTSRLSEDLLHQQLVTPWQAKKLLAGKYKGFFVGNYKILQHIGSGGMSSVYLAEHCLNGQQRAIKVLPHDKLKQKSYLPRFYREAQAVASLNHPNIVRVYDVAQEQGTHHMIMEYVRGTDLHATIAQSGPMDFELAERCIVQAATGLAAAHRQNIIHRDIKPANLLLTHENKIKILDLGLALLKSEDRKFDISAQHDETMMGTVDYLAPEQAINSHDIDHRADIYSLGCTLYFLLTCRPPFFTGTLAERIYAHQNQPPTPIENFRQDCPPHLESICLKMLSKSPDDRFSSANEIVAALDGRQNVSLSNKSVAAKANAIQQPSTAPKPTSNKRRFSYAWIAVAALTVMIAVLGFMVFQRLNDDAVDPFAPTDNTPTIADVATSRVPSTNAAATRSSDNRNGLPKLDTEPGEFLVDFNYRDTFQHTRSGINLFSNRRQFGKLQDVSKNDFQSVRLGNTDVQCIRIEPGTAVPFRPDDKNQLLKSLALELNPTASGERLQITIEAKESISGRDKWQTIDDISSKLNPDEFNTIVLSDELFNKMELRKFRIKVSGGDSTDGVYLKSLSIRFK